MRLIVLTDEELDALAGEPAEVFKFYVCLRRRMDKHTGLVGASVGVSWQALREDMYVDPVSGRQAHGTPTEKYVRHKADRLIAMGLLESQTAYRRLVFLLPKAHTQPVRPKSMGQTLGRYVGQDVGQTKTHAGQGFPDAMGQDVGRIENPAMGHTSEVRVNRLSVVNEIPPPCTEAVDNSDRGASVAAAFVEMIRKAERNRRCVPTVRDTDPKVLAWVEAGVTLDELRDAYRQAADTREMQGDPLPINVGLLDAILRRERNGRRVSKKAEAGPATDARQAVWYATAEGVVGEAARLGIDRAERESVEALKLRCLVELDRRQKRKP